MALVADTRKVNSARRDAEDSRMAFFLLVAAPAIPVLLALATTLICG
jgi:hypothetical protein